MATSDTSDTFVVTARKWRPMNFASVVGQDHISTTLRNAILSKRVHHAYLFTGPRGVGKTTSARILAKALNCQNPQENAEPCGECASCLDIVSGRSIDVIEIDGASNNSVEDVRKLRENAKYPPVNGKYKMYIIDEVHMLSTSAFNALLKTLEEPPPHLVFVFATTEIHKVPATILSRCQRFDFRRMEIESIVGQLKFIASKENVTIDDESLIAIAKKADGSMRDSQSIFDQVLAFCGNDIHYSDVTNALHLIDADFFFTISKSIREHNVAAMFEIAREVMTKGYEVHECLQGLLEHFRNILTILATGNSKLIETSTLFLERYEKEAAHFTQSEVLRLMNIITSTEQALKFSPQPRIRFELSLTQMATLDSTVDITELLTELRALKQAGGGMPPMQQQRPQSPQRPNPPTQTQPNIGTQFPPQTPTAPSNAVTQAQIQSQPQTHGQVAGIEHLKAGWSQFVEKIPIAGMKATLGLQDLIKPQFYNGEILLYVSDDFIKGSIEAKKNDISKELTKYFGAEVVLRVAGGNIATPKSNTGFEDDKPIPASAQGDNPNGAEQQIEHTVSPSAKERLPLEQTIVDLFNAREIPMAGR
ncbi:MAG: DNA polymerase III subunit gamma/tau [Ignavibacteriae bacterium]|nr:DNA polymerase III subunit gamma/tau [Ignavibacteriota bacterium]